MLYELFKNSMRAGVTCSRKHAVQSEVHGNFTAASGIQGGLTGISRVVAA
jgi:hypothetical protein